MITTEQSSALKFTIKKRLQNRVVSKFLEWPSRYAIKNGIKFVHHPLTAIFL
jgi:hypothetical protein